MVKKEREVFSIAQSLRKKSKAMNLRGLSADDISIAEAIGDLLSRVASQPTSCSLASSHAPSQAVSPGQGSADGLVALVYRRVLANLLLDPENPKFRQLKESNAMIKRCLLELPEINLEHITDRGPAAGVGSSSRPSMLHVGLTLFSWIGMRRLDETVPLGDGMLVVPDGTAGITSGDKSRLLQGDALLTLVEDRMAANKKSAQLLKSVGDVDVLPGRRRQAAERDRQLHVEQLRREQELDATVRERAADVRQRSGEAAAQQQLFHQSDFDEVRHLIEVTRKTLHFTGRLRNYSFDAKHYSLRRMNHGRVFACATATSAACPNTFLEAHWHVINGNILYGYVAHLSENGDSVLHIGPEYGYQYNTMPGTPNFGKTVLFAVKVIDPSTGVVSKLDHPNRPVETCIFCDKPFSILLL